MNLWCVLGVFGGVVFCPGAVETTGDLWCVLGGFLGRRLQEMCTVL